MLNTQLSQKIFSVKEVQPFVDYDEHVVLGRMFDAIEKSNEKYASKYKWSGWLAPSSKMSFDMCIEDYYAKVRTKEPASATKQVFEFDLGNSLHEQLQRYFMRYFMEYPVLPRVPDELFWTWVKKRPEIPLKCHILGIFGYCDGVIEYQNTPAPLDYKNNFDLNGTWHERFPVDTHIFQVLSYAYFFNRQYYFDRACEYAILAYANIPNKATKTKVYKLSDYIRKLAEVWYHLGDQRVYALNNEPVVCRNSQCKTHRNRYVL